MQELDVVKIKHSLKTKDVEGDEVLLSAGSQGTVMVTSIDNPNCVVEFGDKPENTAVVTVNKQDLQLVWSPEQQFPKRSTG